MRSLLILLMLAGLIVADLVWAGQAEAETPGTRTADLESATATADPLETAILHFQTQEIDAAEALLLAARKGRPDDAKAVYYLGRVYLEQGRAKEAVDTFEEAIRLDPSAAAYPFWLAEALVVRIEEVAFFFKLGLAKRLRSAYEKAVELDPENLEARVSVARYHSEAPAIAGGSAEKAAAQLEEIRRRDPALGHIAQGLIDEQLGRPEEATQAFETAVVVDPESVLSWRELGYFYQRTDRWDEASRAFEEVLARVPDDPAALYEVAHTAIILSERNLERAEATLEAYLRLEPGPEPVILNTNPPPHKATARDWLARVQKRLARAEPGSFQGSATPAPHGGGG